MSRGDLAELRSAFESLGYKRWTEFDVFSSRDIWYRSAVTADGTFHVLYFRYQPMARAYGITIGVFNEREIPLLESLVPRLLKYMPKSPPGVPFRTLLCWMLFFPKGKTVTRFLAFPDPLDRASWPLQVDELIDAYLRPFFWTIEDVDGAIELLLAEAPFTWSTSTPILRLAEIFVLWKVSGKDSKLLLPRVSTHKERIERTTVGSRRWSELIDDCLSAAGPLH